MSNLVSHTETLAQIADGRTENGEDGDLDLCGEGDHETGNVDTDADNECVQLNDKLSADDDSGSDNSSGAGFDKDSKSGLDGKQDPNEESDALI